MSCDRVAATVYRHATPRASFRGSRPFDGRAISIAPAGSYRRRASQCMRGTRAHACAHHSSSPPFYIVSGLRYREKCEAGCRSCLVSVKLTRRKHGGVETHSLPSSLAPTLVTLPPMSLIPSLHSQSWCRLSHVDAAIPNRSARLTLPLVHLSCSLLLGLRTLLVRSE